MLSKILNEKDGKKFSLLKSEIRTELAHRHGTEEKGENILHLMSIYHISTIKQMIKTFESHGILGLTFGLSDSNKGFWHSKGNSYSDPDSFNSYYWRKDHRDKLIDKLKKLTDKEISKKLKKERFITFLVFHSGKIIQSGINAEFSKDSYYYFLKIIKTAFDEIEERLDV